MSIKKIVVLFSGQGSNLENIIQKLHNKTIKNCTYKIVSTICNKEDANGIKICEKNSIPLHLILHKEFQNREDFDKKLVKTIKSYNPDITVLAGFMRILTPIFTSQIKAINLHPSILPLFKGADAIKKSFYSQMKIGGVSVHFVNEELDSGEIILQECFQKEPDETLESFSKKIKELEFKLLPQAIIKVTR